MEKYDVLLDVIRSRRTIRQFKSDPVPDEYITKIVEAARWAPSAFNTQPWEFVIIREAEVKQRIIDVLERNAPPIKDPAKKSVVRKSYKDAPVFILALCDWRASAGLPGGGEKHKDRIPGLYTSSLANAFVYLHLAATALGLASQWFTGVSHKEAEQKIKDIIGIPEAMTIYDMVVLGYPDAAPQPKLVRETAEMMHYDACGEGDFRTGEAVLEYAKKTQAWCMSEH